MWLQRDWGGVNEICMVSAIVWKALSKELALKLRWTSKNLRFCIWGEEVRKIRLKILWTHYFLTMYGHMKTVFSNSTESVTDKCIKENARFWRCERDTCITRQRRGENGCSQSQFLVLLWTWETVNSNSTQGKEGKGGKLQQEIIQLSYDKPRGRIKKQRHHFADKGPHSQSYGFSSSHVQM